MLARHVLILSGLSVLVLIAVALLAHAHPQAPEAAFRAYLPAITLPTVVVAAAIDGINPCAFTILLLFIIAMLAVVRPNTASMAASRAQIIGRGSVFVAAIFLTYLALGLGLFAAAGLLARQHLPARIAALSAVLLGLWMMKDYFLPDAGWKLHAPAGVAAVARRAARRGTVPALAVGGVLIGLCTVPCSGAVYLGVLSLLALQPGRLEGYAYLVLYNVVFILPLVGILLIASTRPGLARLARWNLHHREWVRLALGSGVVVMGLLVLGTM